MRRRGVTGLFYYDYYYQQDLAAIAPASLSRQLACWGPGSLSISTCSALSSRH